MTTMRKSIDQFRYIRIQPQTIDLSTRLWGINTEFVGFIPQSLVLRSIVWDWILIYRNWSIHGFPFFPIWKAMGVRLAELQDAGSPLLKAKDHWIMQFESFHWLSHHRLWAIISMLYKDCKRTRDVLGSFHFYFNLVFYRLALFLLKKLFHSRLLDTRLWVTWQHAPRYLSTDSYATGARGNVNFCNMLLTTCHIARMSYSSYFTQLWGRYFDEWGHN